MVRNNARQPNVTGPNVARSHTTEPARGAESTTQRKGQQAQSDSAGVGVQPSEPPGPDVTGPDAKGASEGGGTESSEGRGEAGRRRRARRGEDHDGEESSHTYAGGAYREWRECASAWVAEQLAEGGGVLPGPGIIPRVGGCEASCGTVVRQARAGGSTRGLAASEGKAAHRQHTERAGAARVAVRAAPESGAQRDVTTAHGPAVMRGRAARGRPNQS